MHAVSANYINRSFGDKFICDQNRLAWTSIARGHYYLFLQVNVQQSV